MEAADSKVLSMAVIEAYNRLPNLVKTGMLPSLNKVKFLCQSLRKFSIEGIHLYKKFQRIYLIAIGVTSVLTSFLLKAALVVDPVMISTSGDVLASPFVLIGFWYVF
ncbi:Thiamine biosynthetic bifunctional enzyme TH1 [Spatholobus suberectus]|nr:Thiamine biosynthetic bifunctional enzyme TH1 [Spatholobus suberectus]